MLQSKLYPLILSHQSKGIAKHFYDAAFTRATRQLHEKLNEATRQRQGKQFNSTYDNSFFQRKEKRAAYYPQFCPGVVALNALGFNSQRLSWIPGQKLVLSFPVYFYHSSHIIYCCFQPARDWLTGPDHKYRTLAGTQAI